SDRQYGLRGDITPGNMSICLIAMMIERWAGLGGLKRLGLTFRGLVMPGRTIRLCGAVTEKHAERRSVELDVWLESPEGERWVIGTANVEVSWISAPPPCDDSRAGAIEGPPGGEKHLRGGRGVDVAARSMTLEVGAGVSERVD